MDENASHELDLETVFSGIGTEAEMEAMAIKSMLEANGIAAVTLGSPTIPSLPFSVGVSKDHLQEALRIIEEAKAAGPAGAMEAEQAGEL